MDTDIIEAVKAGDMDRVNTLLATAPHLASARDEAGVSVLLLTRYRSNAAMVARLRDAGATVDVGEAAALGDASRLSAILAADPSVVGARSADGVTPLHYAAFFGGVDVARILLDAGAAERAV